MPLYFNSVFELEVVRGMGLEPTQVLPRQNLNLVRLPISPPSLIKHPHSGYHTSKKLDLGW